MLSYMVPARRAFGSNVANNITRNTILFSKLIKDAPSAWRCPNGDNLLFGKLAVRVGRTARRMCRAVGYAVGHIFFARRPSYIFGAVVCSNSIAMCHICLAHAGGAVKCFANKAMNFFRLRFSVDPKIDERIAPTTPYAWPKNLSVTTPDAPKIRGLIQRRGRNNFPQFFQQTCPSNQRKNYTIFMGESKLVAHYALQFQAALQAGGWQ